MTYVKIRQLDDGRHFYSLAPTVGLIKKHINAKTMNEFAKQYLEKYVVDVALAIALAYNNILTLNNQGWIADTPLDERQIETMNTTLSHVVDEACEIIDMYVTYREAADNHSC